MKTGLCLLVIAVTTVLLSHRPDQARNNFPWDTAELKNFGKPDEVREFPKGRVELVKIGGSTIGRATFQPGWKWST